MTGTFNFEGPSDEDKRKEAARQREILLNEILYEWPEETRKQQYRLLVGQDPKPSMTDEHVAESIIDPEKERLRIIAENRAEDQDEASRPWRR